MSIDFIENIRYGAHERNLIDIAFPEGANGDIDLVLMIHGGAWTAGDKDCYTNEIKAFAEGGVVSASMNYRYASDFVHCSDILDDITAALNTVRNVAAERGVNVRKALLTGLSAGGHLSLIYAYSRHDEAPIIPAAVVAKSGPTDMVSDESVNKFLFGNELGTTEQVIDLFSKLCGVRTDYESYQSDEALEAYKSVSPVYFVNEKTVPTVICHAVHDAIVPFCNAETLNKVLEENSVEHDFIAYPTSGHVLEKDPDCTAEADRLTWKYINKYLSVFKG